MQQTELDRHTFLAPANIAIPDAVGRFQLLAIQSIIEPRLHDFRLAHTRLRHTG